VGPRVGLDAVARRKKIPAPAGNRPPDRSSRSLVTILTELQRISFYRSTLCIAYVVEKESLNNRRISRNNPQMHGIKLSKSVRNVRIFD
jgi:hypothetical protein